MTTTDTATLRVEFCGEWYTPEPGVDFNIGRESDLTIDDNPYLHRQFLRLYQDHGMWWLGNVGSLLTATVTDETGQVQAWLAPGARLPIVFQVMHVMFSAGSTTYDFTIHAEEDYFNTAAALTPSGGTTTIMPVLLTKSQRQLIVSLAEHVLKQSVPGRGTIPTSAEAAERLGWSMTTFNRKLDNVCDKLDKVGVPGLRGGKGKLAVNRRARLVEYAVTSRLVSVEDLPLLDERDG
ncbi:hypothetical protein CLV46_1226 [Diaminobutyricimonas aerilata]|uniref:Uncharacterized protein n=1 Tax=Diaminobutyricimonas aerilata TaxID=1162967 RepID=A0A2M9CIC7_9MICO|nr:hypothetical protein [Diaminobutyricimonas aerilata]PJJ71673.1 hypothetical protein CLV46_1226 [Diaminobutyricimonas aerilata]